VADASLAREYTPHILRHTCATWMLWAGVDFREVARFIGANTHELERTYGHHKLDIELSRERA
jgi:site-specific recombinase XerD